MAELKHRRNRLLPWYVGLAIVAAAISYVGYRLYNLDCGIAPIEVFLVLLVVPVVYLTLMYLAFTSQE